jgi:hypothetical protein
MTASAPRRFRALLALAAVAAAGAAPADDLLPPPVRQTEKRSLGGNDDRTRRFAYDGRGGFGAAFSPDGKYLVTAAGFQGMTLWDVAAGRAAAQLPNPSNNMGLSVAFTPDGAQFVATNWGNPGGGGPCPVALWNAGKREKVRGLDDDVNDTPFTALAVAPDGKTVALAAGFGRRNEAPHVSLWDLASGDEVGRVEGLVGVDPTRRNFGGGVFLALAYSPDGRTLAALVEGRVLLVEVATGKVRGQLAYATAPEPPSARQGQAVTFGALAFSPDGRTLAAGCPDGAVRRFDLRAGRELPPLPGHGGPVVALCCPPDGKSILSYGLDGQFYVWRAEAGRDWKPKAGPLSDADLDALWDALRGDDPLDQYGGTQALAACPGQAVPYLRKRLAPAPKEDAERLDRLVADVQKGDYNARKKAVIELRKAGAAAVPALIRSQQKGAFDELSQRLLFEFSNQAPPPEQLRAIRALAVLERVGDADARKLLEELAGGAPDAALTTQAKAALDRLSEARPEKADPAPDALWDALASEDGAAAYRAVRALAARPDAAALLRDRLKEVGADGTFDDDPKRVARLIGELDSDDFAVREQANKDLRNLGRLVAPSLRKALEAKPDVEAKQRLEKLLDQAGKTTPPEVLRVGRALEALELMGGSDAVQALEAVRQDARTAWLREAARESLRRQGEADR